MLGNTTVITYDALGRKIGMKDPDMGVWGYGYDGNGNLINQQDNKNQTLTFGFDTLNRMTDKSVNGTLYASFGYDQIRAGAYNIGQRTSTWRKNVGTSQADYDQRGRPITITQTTDSIAFTTVYTYDSANRIKAMRYPDGENVSFGFNEAMQPTTVSGKASIVTGATYTPMGQFAQIDFGNTTSAYYSYYNTGSNPSFRLKGIEVKKGATSHLNLQYGYDNVGNVKVLTDTTFANVNYTYDPLDRLTSASGAVNESYTYDQIGNIKNKSDVGGYSYGTKPHAVTSAGSLSFGYDLNGNMVTRTLGVVMYAQGWDAENKLIAVSSSDGAQPTTWAYDADGMRVKRTIGGKTTLYVGNYYELETSRVFVPNTQRSYSTYWKPETLTAASGKVRKYYYLGNTRVAMNESGIMRWLQGDNLGSASLATDVLGNVISNIRYKPFGEQRDSAAFVTNRKFNGMIEEPQAGGLYDFGARMYLAKIGRFVSADDRVPQASNSQDWNRYSFVRNNPLGYVDPSGHIPYPITIRSFAPFEEFGGLLPGGRFHGDGRGFSTDSGAISRASATIDFDTDATTVSISAISNPSWQIANPSNAKIAKDEAQITRELSIIGNGDVKQFSFESYYGASNPFVELPSIMTSIDVFASINVIENKSAHFLKVSAKLTGDNFPSTEAFITDPRGKSVFIGIGFYEKAGGIDIAPMIQLPGQTQRHIFKQTFQINLDKEGNFLSVLWGGKTWSLYEWNKRFYRANPSNSKSFYGK